MDRLDVTDKHFDSKYADIQERLNRFYDQIAETDNNIREGLAKLAKLFDGRTSMENALHMIQTLQDNLSSMPDAIKSKCTERSPKALKSLKIRGRTVGRQKWYISSSQLP